VTSRSHTIVGVDNGARYNVKVRAVNAIREGAAASAAATPRTLPGEPRNLTAVPGDGMILLSWEAPISDGGGAITRYQYSASTGEDNWQNLPDSSAVDTRYIVLGLTNATEYTLRVRAVNDAGNGEAISIIAAPVKHPASAPGAPLGLRALPGDQRMKLDWTAPLSSGGSPITKYQYSASTGGDNWQDVPNSGAATDSYTVMGLTNGLSYTLKVRAVNEADYGAEIITIATPRTIPDAPGGLTAIPGDAIVELKWTTPADDGGSAISKYQYSVSTDGGDNWQDISASGPSTTRFTVFGLINGDMYNIKVRAVNEAGEGAASGVTATPQRLLYTAPGAPQGLTVTPLNGGLFLTWISPTENGGSAITKYQYSASIGADDWKDVPDSGEHTTSYSITNLTNGTRYTVKLRAVNSTDNGVEVVATGIPRTTPGAPGELAALPGDGRIDITWSAPLSDGGSPITKYQYSASANADEWFDIPGSGPGTTGHHITGLMNGINYTVKLRAVNGAGAGDIATIAALPQAEPEPTHIGTPGNVEVTVSDGEITLTWENPEGDDDVIWYEYSISTQGGVDEWKTIPATGANGGSVTISGLDNGVEYIVKVRAVDKDGAGEAAVIIAEPTAVDLDEPAGFTAVAGDGEIILAWTASSGEDGVVKYQYSVSTGGNDWRDIPGSDGDTDAFVITGLENDTEYTVKVRAVNDEGGGTAVSLTVTPTQGSPPDTPPVVPKILGDLDGDNAITTDDAVIILRFAVGDIDYVDPEVGDINRDGAVDADDAVLILMYAIGLIDSFE